MNKQQSIMNKPAKYTVAVYGRRFGKSQYYKWIAEMVKAQAKKS